MAARRIVLLIILGTALARIAIAAATGLGIDEAYSVGNARILSLSTVDHPPLHIWIVGLAMRLAGSEAALVVRLPFIVLFAGSTWLMYRLGRMLYGEQAGLWAAVWLNLAPVFSLVHAGGVLPDGPLIFFLLASANVLADILFGKPRRLLFAWAGAGVLAGLALLSKYNAVFLVIGVFAFLATVPGRRFWLTTPGPWLALLATALVFSPAIVWNLQHGMAGFAFQGGRATVAGGGGNILLQVVGQAIYLTPWLLVPLAIALVRALRRGPAGEKEWFLALLAVGPIAVFTLMALWSPGLPHWPMPGWLFAMVLPPLLAHPALLRRYAIVSASLVGLAALGFGLQASGFGVPQSTFAEWRAPDPTVDMVDWEALPRALAARGLLGPDTFVAAPQWRAAGKASHALGPAVPVFCFCGDPHHFPFRADLRAAAGKDVVLVWVAAESPGWTPRPGSVFERVEPLGRVVVERRGEPVLTLELALGRRFRLPEQ